MFGDGAIFGDLDFEDDVCRRGWVARADGGYWGLGAAEEAGFFGLRG